GVGLWKRGFGGGRSAHRGGACEPAELRSPSHSGDRLTTDTSILTSIGNDSSFDNVFERQVRALGRKSDVALAISTSGNSPNVLRAVEAAREIGVTTIALAGRTGGKLATLAELALVVNADSTQRIQETHITIAHILCELVEDALYGQPL